MQYMNRSRMRGQNTLTFLAKNAAFMQAIDSPIGMELLKDLAARHTLLLEKVASLDSQDRDKIELQVVREIMELWSMRITKYLAGLDGIGKGKGEAQPEG